MGRQVGLGCFLCSGLKGAIKKSSDQLRITSLARGNMSWDAGHITAGLPSFPSWAKAVCWGLELENGVCNTINSLEFMCSLFTFSFWIGPLLDHISPCSGCRKKVLPAP